MSDFEREIVNCLNRFFKTRQIPGFAYRLRQSRLTSRHPGVLADSLNPSFNLSVECRSIIDKKLYVSQHFHADRNRVNPVDAISDFLAKTGRVGYLAVEFRQGPGNVTEAFLIPWPVVVGHFRKNRGISIDDARGCVALTRTKGGYQLDSLNAK